MVTNRGSNSSGVKCCALHMTDASPQPSAPSSRPSATASAVGELPPCALWLSSPASATGAPASAAVASERSISSFCAAAWGVPLNTRVTATAAASRVSAVRSAPTKPGVFLAMNDKSTAPSSLIFLVKTCRIRSRPFSSGTPRQISRSKRPARRRA
eukprot:scaffold2113_cov233-Pinguiococcus_pyrenoidosus.AAC.15